MLGTLGEDELFLGPVIAAASRIISQLCVFFLQSLFALLKILDELFKFDLLAAEVVFLKLPVGALLLNREEQLSPFLLGFFRFLLGVCEPGFEAFLVAQDLHLQLLKALVGFGLELVVCCLQPQFSLFGL